LIGGLVEYAKSEFTLQEAQKDGVSLRHHLQRVWDMTGVMPEQLEPIEVEDEVLYLWDYFTSMNQRRTSNGFGENPISASEMKAWSELNGIPISTFEVQAIQMLELAYMRRKSHD